MADHLVAFSIPFFLILIALEAFYLRRKRGKKLRLNDTLTNLNCGTITLVFELFTKGGLFLIFNYVATNWGLYSWDMAAASTWIIFFFIYDFFYYWGHRLAHSVNFMWGGHLPHHQSEEYNLSVALRQGAFQDTVNFPVFLPMAFMGCPIEVFAVVLLLNKFFQLWVHTEAIGRVPFIEGILNTPSAHRVHHAVNSRYVDKNHGGVIMLWDRLFGTWSSERDAEPCIYGVRKPYRSWNPLYAHVDWWARLWEDSVNTERWQDKVKLWFMPTGWRPQDVAKTNPWKPYDIARYQKYDPWVNAKRMVAAVVLFLSTLPLISHLLYKQFELPLLSKLGIAAVIVVCLGLCGYFLGGAKAKRNSSPAENEVGIE